MNRPFWLNLLRVQLFFVGLPTVVAFVVARLVAGWLELSAGVGAALFVILSVVAIVLWFFAVVAWDRITRQS